MFYGILRLKMLSASKVEESRVISAGILKIEFLIDSDVNFIKRIINSCSNR